MKIVDGRFEYEDERFPMGSDCACRLRVYALRDGRHVVIATELENSPGASVTNSAERWAEESVKEYGLSPVSTVFIEHYDRGGTSREFPDGHSFSTVSFRWSADRAEMPKWVHATREMVEVLIAEPLQ